MTPDAPVTPSAQLARSVSRPHIAEWFEHRVFPVVATGDSPVSDQQSHRCPFLTLTLKTSTGCVKAANSRGVCTISAASNGSRQDWLVCPYRALDDGLLADMVKRLYSIPALDPVLIRPVVALDDQAGRTEIRRALPLTLGEQAQVQCDAIHKSQPEVRGPSRTASRERGAHSPRLRENA